jgi:hypothetical protein
MNTFAERTRQVFENYHNTPYEGMEWGLTDALGHIMEFLAHHDSIDDMPGLREVLSTMTAKEWESWQQRYPEHSDSIIYPLYREIVERVT